MASRQVSTGGGIVAITGGVFLLDSLLPWHRQCLDLFGNKTCYSENAWGTSFSLLASLLALALVAEVIAVQLMDVKLPAVGTFSWAQIRLAAAAAVAALVVIQLLAGDGGLGRSFGLFLGVLLAGGILYGTIVRNRETAPAPS